MIKVAILDDYQNVSHEFVNLKKLSRKYEFKIFNEPFINEDHAIEQLAEFEALLIMRERTPITKNLIDNLKKLKFIITSGMRNKAIDFEAAKKRKINAISFTGHSYNNPLSKISDLSLWVESKAYNFIENTHQIWLLTVCDSIIGKREYPAKRKN